MSWRELLRIQIYHGYLAQILIAELFFTSALNKKDHFSFRFTVGLMLCLLLAIAVPNAVAYYVGNGLFCLSIFFVSILFWRFCFSNTFYEILFCCIGAQLTQNLANNIEGLAVSFIRAQFGNVGWFIWSVTVMFAVYTVCYLIFARRFRTLRQEEDKAFFAFAIATTLFTYIMQYLFQLYELDGLWITRPPLIVCCIFGLCVQYERVALSNEKRENQILEMLIVKERQQYERIKGSMELINMKAHDLKYYIAQFRSTGDMNESGLQEIESAISTYEVHFDTGCKTLDTLLTEKQLVCQENHIQLTVIAQGEPLNLMAASDIVSLFGNALDNAIECELKVENKDRRYISVNIFSRGNLVSIRVENYCSEKPAFFDGLPATTKQDKNSHGFGIKSIRYIAQKYGGTLQANAGSSRFVLSILLSLG